MKKLLLFFFLSVFSQTYAQSLELSAGYIRNTYYDLEEENPHYSSDYSGGNGYAVKLSVEKLRLLDSILPIRLDINFTNYKGQAEITTGGQSSRRTAITDINKSVLGFSIYPLLFRIKKNFRIDIGLEVDLLLNDNSTGYYKSWQIEQPDESGEITDFNHNTTTFAVLFQTGYEFALKNNWSVYPRYHLYAGITDDFGNTHSLRNQFEVGLIRRIK